MSRKSAVADLGQTSVISQSELQTMRILTNTTPRLTSEQELANTRRMMSKSRYQHWPNTLEAQRQKKEYDRLQRLEKIEEAQQSLDQRENTYREQEKREGIARANRLLYQENDRVKTLRTSILLSNALHEREAQADYKQQYNAMKAEHQAQIDREVEEYAKRNADRERREQELRKQKAFQATRDLEKQMRDKYDRHCDVRRNDIREAMEDRQKAIEAELDAQEAERLKIENARRQAMDLEASNREHQKFKKSLAVMDDLEEERIQKHSADKQRMQGIRKGMEDDRKRLKQERLDSMISKQQAHLSKVKEEENARLNRQIDAMNKKLDEKSQHQADYRSKLQNDLLDGRRSQLQHQAEELLMKKEVEKTMGDEWKRMNAYLEQQEKDLELKEKMDALQLQDTLRSQVVSRQEKERQDRLEEFRHAQRVKKQNEYDDYVFNRYVEHHVNELDAQGKDTLPLKLTIHKMDLKARKIAY